MWAVLNSDDSEDTRANLAPRPAGSTSLSSRPITEHDRRIYVLRMLLFKDVWEYLFRFATFPRMCIAH